MARKFSAIVAASALPALFVSLLFYFLLGHRRDYLGHYAAGYGGTLCAAVIVLAGIPAPSFRRIAHATVLPCTLLCIVAGAVAEATVFRLAKFDQIDFCNQSLGAVMAGLAAISIVGYTKPNDAAFRCSLVIGIVFLLIGGYFAVI
jgi:hypothetical protein